MEAKDKAKELVDKFKENCWHNVSVHKGFGVSGLKTIYDIDKAKQCAIICCNEIINTHNHINKIGLGGYNSSEVISYWQEVKQGIEKL